MAAGDIDARFTSMFERHYNEVLAYCVRRTNRAEADDVSAEVFAVAWRRSDEIEWETVRPWQTSPGCSVPLRRRPHW